MLWMFRRRWTGCEPRSIGCRRSSPIRSPPARSSSGRPRSSRNWSRTPSTPAPAGSPIAVEFGGKKLDRRRGRRRGHDGARTPRWRSSGTRRARFARPASGGDPDAGVSRRGAAVDRVGLALPAAHAGAGRAPAHRDPRRGGRRRVDPRAKWARRGHARSKSRDLFFNLPARRKFLKADTAEAAQISRLVTQLALGYPDVGFRAEERRARACSTRRPPHRSTTASTRSTAIAPISSPVAKQAAGIDVHGFVAALAEQGPVRGPQHVFVNRRIVSDRTIAHAIQQAYSVATIKERSPEVHLFVDLPADRVDVNVHPTKAEVRFLIKASSTKCCGAPWWTRWGRARRRSWCSRRDRSATPQARSGRCRSDSPAAQRRQDRIGQPDRSRFADGAGPIPIPGADLPRASRPPDANRPATLIRPMVAARAVPQHVHHRRGR